MNVLYIRIEECSASAEQVWYLCEAGETRANASGSLADLEKVAEELSQSVSNLEIVLLIPDEDVLLVDVEVPGRSASRIRQAAPFAVEPFLAEDIEAIHIAYGDVKRDKSTLCVAINRQKLERYLALFEDTSVNLTGLSTLGTVINADPLALIENKTSVSIRTQSELAVIHTDLLPTALAQAIDGETAPNEIMCIGGDSLAHSVNDALAELGQTELPITLTSIADVLTSASEAKSYVNLLQGDFSTAQSSVNIERVWYRAALSAGAAILLVSTMFFVQGLWANYETQLLHEQSLDVFEDVYGTRDVAGNPVFRMQERMGAINESDSVWLTLFERVVEAGSLVDMSSLEMNVAQEKITMSFNADTFAQFEDFRSRLERAQLKLDVNLAEQQNNRVWARVTVTLP